MIIHTRSILQEHHQHTNDTPLPPLRYLPKPGVGKPFPFKKTSRMRVDKNVGEFGCETIETDKRSQQGPEHVNDR